MVLIYLVVAVVTMGLARSGSWVTRVVFGVCWPAYWVMRGALWFDLVETRAEARAREAQQEAWVEPQRDAA